MSFADSRRPQKNDVACLGGVIGSGGKLLNETPVNARLRWVLKVFEAFKVRKTSELQVEFHGSAVAFLKFVFQQVSKEVGVVPVFGTRLLTCGVELGKCGLQSELLESLMGFLFVGDHGRRWCVS